MCTMREALLGMCYPDTVCWPCVLYVVSLHAHLEIAPRGTDPVRERAGPRVLILEYMGTDVFFCM